MVEAQPIFEDLSLGTEEKRGTTFRSSTDEIFETLEITKLDKGKNQSIREKLGVHNIVKEIKQYQQKWLQHVQGQTQIEYQTSTTM
jgi:hypothetical protein